MVVFLTRTIKINRSNLFRTAICLILVAFSVPSYGQKLKRLKVFCTDSFDPKASITVEALSFDPCMVADALKNSLVTNGFKVVSERVGKELTETNNSGRVSDESFTQDISTGRTKYVKSVYVITLKYQSRSDMGCSGCVITNLNGQIVDLVNDGEIVSTFSLTQSEVVGRCTSKIMDALAQALKARHKGQ